MPNPEGSNLRRLCLKIAKVSAMDRGVLAIEDDAVERALHEMADRLAFQVDAHDITLHGRCANCAGAAHTH